MKQVKVKLFHFDELSEDAKAKVCDKEREDTYNFGTLSMEDHASERYATLDKFCDVFGIKYTIDYDHDYRFISWHINDTYINDEEICGKLLWRYLDKVYYDIRSRKWFSAPFKYDENGKMYYKDRYSRIQWVEQNCPFTGMVYDCDILYEIFKWYNKPDWNISLHDLLDDCLHAFLKSWADEDDYDMSDENIGDLISANWPDKLYFEDGTEFNGVYEDEEEGEDAA